MDTQEDLVPPSLVPRRLVRQAAEKIALQIVRNCHTALVRSLFDPEEEVRDLMIMHLKRLKEQYWNDECGLMDPFRRHISSCFTDVMEVYSSKVEVMPAQILNILQTSVDSLAPEVIVTLTAQILFTYEVGYSSELDMLYILCLRGVTKRLEKLLETIGVLRLETLSTAFIMFEETAPLLTLIKNSPCLKHIYIVNNSSMNVLECIRTYSKNIESFHFKLFSYYSVLKRRCSLKDFLFEIFFDGLGMDAVMKIVHDKKQVPKSFPKLKHVIFDNSSANSVPIKEFMYCLQYFYPDINVRWSHYMNVREPNLTIPLSNFQLMAPFSDRDYYKWDTLQIGYIDGIEIIDDNSGYRGEYPDVNHMVIEVSSVFNNKTKNFIEVLMERHQCRSLELAMYLRSLLNNSELASAFDNIGTSLQTLSLNVYHDVLVSELTTALNACLLLEVLSLELHLVEYTNAQNSFKKFLKMNCLTLVIYPSQRCTKEDSDIFKAHLIGASPNITTLRLTEITDVGLDRLDVRGLVNLTSFQIGCNPCPQNLISFIQRLPSLSVLALTLNYRQRHSNAKSIYYSIKDNFKGTCLNVYGFGKFSHYSFKQLYEF